MVKTDPLSWRIAQAHYVEQGHLRPNQTDRPLEVPRLRVDDAIALWPHLTLGQAITAQQRGVQLESICISEAAGVQAAKEEKKSESEMKNDC